VHDREFLDNVARFDAQTLRQIVRSVAKVVLLVILLLTIIPVMLINIRRFQAQEAIR